MDEQVLAWIAVAAAALALAKAVYDFWHKGKTDKLAIDEALERAPEVQRQLELGNVGEAVKHLNTIIQNQAGHIDRLEASNRRCNDREEAQGREIELMEGRARRQDDRIAHLEAVLERHGLDFEVSPGVQSNPHNRED